MTMLRTYISKDGKRLCCGKCKGRSVLGDIQRAGSFVRVLLLEGFRSKAGVGVYELHKHAQERHDRDQPPRDAKGRWVGPVQQADGSWTFDAGPLVSLEGIPPPDGSDPEVAILASLQAHTVGSGLQRQRQRYREEVKEGDEVRCPRCTWPSAVALDAP